MTIKFGVMVPQGWRIDLAGISDPIEAYETMTRVAQEAEASESMRKRISDYEEAGVQELILWFPDAAKLESLQLFAREFIKS
jgi:hypothetical protein